MASSLKAPVKRSTTRAVRENRAIRTHLQHLHAVAIVCIAMAFALSLYLGTSQLLWSVIALVTILVVGLLWSRAVTNSYALPLEALALQAERFAAGERDLVFTNERGSTEVGIIADALNEIGASVREANAELATEEQRQAQFVSDVSHEIRTPLTAIQGTAETLIDPDMPQPMRERFLSNIVDECQRLTRLANDLLTLQRIEGTKGELAVKRINLRSIAESTALTLEALLDERKAHLTISGEAPDVLGDPDRIRQVITNLIENASRFAPEGGHIHVELSGIDRRSVISVSDDGPGFGNVDPARLFDRFYRADSSRTRGRGTGGTGLGLAIVKTIVDAHDGTVQAVNLPNHGACFIVALPSLPPAE
jgi:two-component system OmpR family sensor kinase